jgi:hypothetical protein
MYVRIVMNMKFPLLNIILRITIQKQILRIARYSNGPPACVYCEYSKGPAAFVQGHAAFGMAGWVVFGEIELLTHDTR